MPPAVGATAPAPGPAGALAAARAVPTVSVALDVLARRGATTARLTLKPEALGGVDVHLRHTAKGLDVRLTAEGAEAGRALHASAELLRQRLESTGVTVLRLEVADPTTAATGGDATGRDATSAGSGTGDGRPGSDRPGSGRGGTRATIDLPTDPDDRTTLTLPDGALVDVLA
jgi:hypothetical protein